MHRAFTVVGKIFALALLLVVAFFGLGLIFGNFSGLGVDLPISLSFAQRHPNMTDVIVGLAILVPFVAVSALLFALGSLVRARRGLPNR